MIRFRVLGAALLAAATPAVAQDVTPAPEDQPAAPVPAIVAPPVAAAPVSLTWPAVFAALHARNWTGAAAAIDAMADGPLKPVARAELYLGSGAPAIDGPTVAALVTAAPHLPQAPALAALARARGAPVPSLPIAQPLMRTAGASKRQAARANRADAAYSRVASQVQPLLKTGDAASAEPLVEAASLDLAPEALTEWRQRIAWSYFQIGDDASARRVATMAQAGPGEWAVQAAWVAGLAAWRMADYRAAADAFAQVAARGPDGETRAAGLYWQARADTAGGRPERVAPVLRSAAAGGETFYGMLAATALGVTPRPLPATPNPSDALLRYPNLRAAAALQEIGER